MWDNEDKTCVICASTPCEWEEFGTKVVEHSRTLYRREMRGEKEVVVFDNGAVVPNNTMRRQLYRIFTYLKYGHLGKGNRMPIPSCVTTQIRNMFPDEEYMGFMEE